MGKVRNRTQAALREFVGGNIEEKQLKHKLRRVERRTTGGNPHNIGMATFEFTNRSAIDDETEQKINRVHANTFPNHKLPGKFPEKSSGE